MEIIQGITPPEARQFPRSERAPEAEKAEKGDFGSAIDRALTLSGQDGRPRALMHAVFQSHNFFAGQYPPPDSGAGYFSIGVSLLEQNQL